MFIRDLQESNLSLTNFKKSLTMKSTKGRKAFAVDGLKKFAYDAVHEAIQNKTNKEW